MAEYAAKAADAAAANLGDAAGEHMRWGSARARTGRAHARPMTSIARGDPGRLAWESSMKLVRRPSTTQIAQHYKLTPSELRVLHTVVEGAGGIRAIADALGSSQATVKTHLHHIFQKTGVRRQIDLVKLVAGIGNPSIE